MNVQHCRQKLSAVAKRRAKLICDGRVLGDMVKATVTVLVISHKIHLPHGKCCIINSICFICFNSEFTHHIQLFVHECAVNQVLK